MTEKLIRSDFVDSDVAEALDYCAKVAEIHKGAEKKYYIETFGCQQNEADSERLGGLCVAMGYSRTQVADEADLILVNTCAVREHAEKKALSIIGSFKHVREKNPSLIIGVGGCMVTQKSRSDKLRMSYPYVSFTFDTGAVSQVPRLIYTAITGKKRNFVLSDEWKISEGVPICRNSTHSAWLSIMYGCNNFCSYCIVPYVRGRERSRSAEAIIAEARQLIDSGAKEITLLGQNVNSYNGGGGVDIAELMHKICALDGDFRLRFMTSHPKDASERLIEAMATEDKIVKHFHLPVQSGSDEILRRMNRKYDSEAYLRKIELLKKAVPDVTITSDIIVGFPGESEADFEATLDMMREVEYDMVFSFIYSPRTGTPAATMPDQIPHEVSSDRMARLLELGSQLSNKRNSRFVGRVEKVLVDGVSRTDSGMLSARCHSARPIHFAGDESMIGTFRDVKITEASTYSLIAEINK